VEAHGGSALRVLTEGEGARRRRPRGQRLVPGGAPQRLPVRQHGAVQRHRQALRGVRCVHASLAPLAPQPAERRGGVRAQPAAVELGVGGVLCRRPHALRVPVRDV